MTAEERIDPLGPYREIRHIKEGSVFAKYRVRKKLKKPEKKHEEETSSSERKSSEHRIDIEA